MTLPRAAERSLEQARRTTALQVDTLAHAVTSLDDEVGWARLTELGTASVVRAQTAALEATADTLNATLEAAGLVGDFTPDGLPIRAGLLQSGRPVRGMFAATPDIVARRMTGGAATFPEALDASAHALTGYAASEPHRIHRDAQLEVGTRDPRFGRYRRVAVGTTCTFCNMLATRGAVYLTAESAGMGRRYHRMCDCYVELVVDDAAIGRTKSLEKDWRNAIADPDRMRAADVRREWSQMPDEFVEAQARAGSREALAEAARRATPVPAPAVPEPAAAPQAAARMTPDAAERLTNADLEKAMGEAWDAGDDDLATMLEDEMERRASWAKQWGRDYDEYDDWRPLDPTDLDDADLPDFDDIPQQPELSRRQIRAEWEDEMESRIWDAEEYGGGIRPDMAAEAAEKGITLRTLMTGDPRTAYKYANQELLTWWDRNGGRMPLWERMAAHGKLDKRTSLERLRLTEDKARSLAQELLGKNRAEAMARRGAEQAARRRAAAGPLSEGDRLAAAQRRYQRARRMAGDG